MKLIILYLLFAKISIFTFGGGYAMIPLFQNELVTRNAYITEEEFANMVAIAQMTPGPIGLNAATYIGYDQAGFPGSLVATLGLMTPSFIITFLAAIFLAKAKNNPVLNAALHGIRPAVLGLIAAAVIFFANTSVFTAPLNNLLTGKPFALCWQGTAIFFITIILTALLKVNMLTTLITAALLGWALFMI